MASNLEDIIHVVGKKSVGKGSLIKRYVFNIFDAKFKLNFSTPIIIKKDEIQLNFKLYETKEGDKITFPPSDRAVQLLLFDLTQLESFNLLKDKEIKNLLDPNVLNILVGTKLDKVKENLENRKVSRAVAEQLSKAISKHNRILYFETSAKTGEGISELINTCVKEIETAIQIKRFIVQHPLIGSYPDARNGKFKKAFFHLDRIKKEARLYLAETPDSPNFDEYITMIKEKHSFELGGYSC